MNTVQNKIYGECFHPETFIELTSIFVSESETSKGKTYLPVMLWRGQGNIEWPIDSSGYRRVAKSIDKEVRDIDLESYEKKLLDQATHQGYRLHDGRILSDLELLAKLQHHGAATRLVDFSKNALVGLWFAVNNQPNKTGLLIGIHTSYIGGLEGTNEERKYEDVIQMCKKHSHPQVYESPAITSRIAAQHAQFLYSGVSKSLTGSLSIPSEAKARLCIAISPRNKIIFKEILTSVYDFKTLSLYPDINGFGMANHFTINKNEMYRW